MLLIPIEADGKKRIVLPQRDIRSVTLTEKRLPELEIQTGAALYSGILEKGCSFAEAVSYFKEHVNGKIICEYKGGEKND